MIESIHNSAEETFTFLGRKISIDQKPEFQNLLLNEYIKNCNLLNMAIDSNICSCLNMHLPILEPKKGNFARLLPLKNILNKAYYIQKIVMPGQFSITCGCLTNYDQINHCGSSDANILGQIIKDNKFITELVVANYNIGIDGLRSLCNGLSQNTSVEKLDLSGNIIGEESI